MKNANNTGGVVKLSGNRRRPWIARMISTYHDKGYPIYTLLSDDNGNRYFATKEEAEEVRLEYLKNEGIIDTNKRNYTFKQVYEEYSRKNFPTKEEMERERLTHEKTKGKMGRSIANNLKSAYNKCSAIENKLYKTLKKSDFEQIILNTDGCATVINSLANLFRKLDNYALENDIIVKGYANLLKITDDLYKEPKSTGTPYTYEEIDTLWQNEGNIIADITLITIYTGLRIEEALFTKNADIYLKDNYFIAGLKTKAGKRRIVPIHHDIYNIINKYHNTEKEFLFTINNEKIDYNSYFLKMYRKLMEELNMPHHKTHDGRKTLHTELDRVNANKVCVDRIFGHKSGNIGEDAYTKKSLEELQETIELVNYKDKKCKKVTYLKVHSAS